MDWSTMGTVAVASMLGGLVTTVVFSMRVLPQKMSRAEVMDAIDRHPLQTRIKHLENHEQWSKEELGGIRKEIVGLRTDFARFTGVMEQILRHQSSER